LFLELLEALFALSKRKANFTFYRATSRLSVPLLVLFSWFIYFHIQLAQLLEDLDIAAAVVESVLLKTFRKADKVASETISCF
jgi:hypothetical protein